MKKCGFFRKSISLALIFLPAMLGFFAVSLAVKKIPDAVTYSVISVKTDVTEVNEPQPKIEHRQSVSLQSLPVTGKYKILAENGKILVYDEKGTELYTVKADLSEFPKDDIASLQKGIVAENRGELLEIVTYLES